MSAEVLGDTAIVFHKAVKKQSWNVYLRVKWILAFKMNCWQQLGTAVYKMYKDIHQPEIRGYAASFMNLTGFKDFYSTIRKSVRLSSVCKPHRSVINAQCNIYLNRYILDINSENKKIMIRVEKKMNKSIYNK